MGVGRCVVCGLCTVHTYVVQMPVPVTAPSFLPTPQKSFRCVGCPQEECAAVGTLYKDMALRPSVLKEYLDDLELQVTAHAASASPSDGDVSVLSLRCR